MELRKDYKVYSLHNFRKIKEVQEHLSKEQIFDIEVVGNVLPFKVSNYTIDELINWDKVPDDPMFNLTFPQKEMLLPEHYRKMADALRKGVSKPELKKIAYEIRLQLNPHPAGQLKHNVPTLNGQKLTGIQHKYEQTMLFFPSPGQTCHSYCTFCFRWPQFIGVDELKFGMKEAALMVDYLKVNPQVTDVLFTGGDPLVMSSKKLGEYINPLLEEDLPHVDNIRIGTKGLSHWPYRFLSDKDSSDLLRLFEKVNQSGKRIALMAHFSHTTEMETTAVQEAIRLLRNAGVQIRTQSPVLKHINADPNIWRDMWKKQVKEGCIPYYMFIARDTGAQDYFAVPVVKAWEIFKEAYEQVSGLARTVRGPSMSAAPGKVQILGASEVNNEKVIGLRFIQGRNPEWVHKPFFAEYDPEAKWLNDLKPAFGKDRFFFEDEYPLER